MAIASQADFPAATPSRVVLGRRATAGLAWLILGLIGVQIYLAAVFLMSDTDTRTGHEGLGWMLGYGALVTLVVAAFASLPRTFWLPFVAFVVLVHAVPFITFLSADGGAGLLRALHPVAGVALVGLSWHVARVATRTLRAKA